MENDHRLGKVMAYINSVEGQKRTAEFTAVCKKRESGRRKKWLEARFERTPEYRRLLSWRQRLASCLFKTGQRETGTAMKLCGCSWQELRAHFERQFRGGMNWGNHGHKGWVIDHVRACSDWDWENLEELKKCFHWKNLRPLWYWENKAKGVIEIRIASEKREKKKYGDTARDWWAQNVLNRDPVDELKKFEQELGVVGITDGTV